MHRLYYEADIGGRMTCRMRTVTGFTIIELMVTVAIMMVVTMLALPSFEAARQRAVTRGAADQLLNFWNQARLEALKRNQYVKVNLVQSNSGKTFCLGARLATVASDTTPCNCVSTTPADADYCDVARFPADNGEWRSVSLTGVTLGGGTNLTNMEPVVIDPKRLMLAVPGDAGTVTLAGPPGRRSYKLNMSVDRFGRAYLCQSSTAVDTMSDFSNTGRLCPP